jgi:hypothetical protein
VPLTALALLWLVHAALVRVGLDGPAVGFVLGVCTLLTALPGLVCLPIALWTIYRAGQEAFGARAGLGYLAVALVLGGLPGLGLPLGQRPSSTLGLAFALASLLGIWIVPDMVRADVRRLLDEPGDDPDKKPG